MYDWWTLSPDERLEVTLRRFQRGYPPHELPHLKGTASYFITAACYEHQPLMTDPQRRQTFASRLLQAATDWSHGQVHAWVVLPNHYHLLWEGDLQALSRAINRLHSGTATQWNREDGCPGRRVFFRFADRQIRSDTHFYASMNYAHGNPVKHHWTTRADQWDTTSLHDWLSKAGRPALADLWRLFPTDRYGTGWDD